MQTIVYLIIIAVVILLVGGSISGIIKLFNNEDNSGINSFILAGEINKCNSGICIVKNCDDENIDCEEHQQERWDTLKNYVLVCEQESNEKEQKLDCDTKLKKEICNTIGKEDCSDVKEKIHKYEEDKIYGPRDNEKNIISRNELTQIQIEGVLSNSKEVISNLKNIKFESTNGYEFMLKYSQSQNIDPYLVLSIISIESGGKMISNEDSVGIMQITKELGIEYGIVYDGAKVSRDDRKDPKKNLETGIKYLKDLLEENDMISSVLAAYNGGRGALEDSENCENMMKYECLWDDNEHVKINIGYDETRDYILKYEIANKYLKENYILN